MVHSYAVNQFALTAEAQIMSSLVDKNVLLMFGRCV